MTLSSPILCARVVKYCYSTTDSWHTQPPRASYACVSGHGHSSIDYKWSWKYLHQITVDDLFPDHLIDDVYSAVIAYYVSNDSRTRREKIVIATLLIL